MRLVDALESGIGPIWMGSSFAMGCFVRRGINRWESAGGRRVLVIAPHPDDEALSCAGTLILHARNGDAVSLAYITDGSRSRAQGLNPDQMRMHRRREAEAAAAALMASHFNWIGLPEGTWCQEQFGPPMLKVLRGFSPDIIYAPSRVDFHPEHHKVAHALARLLSAQGGEFARTLVRVYQLQVPLTPVLTNLVTDCASVSREAADALQVYQSQSDNTGRALRMWRYAALCYGLKRHAEEFWQMTLDQYCRLHTSRPESWNCAAFRGIRYRSFSDPLAYLSGVNERRRLRNAASALIVHEQAVYMPPGTEPRA